MCVIDIIMDKRIISVVNYINFFGALYLVATAILRDFKVHEIGYYIFFFSYILEIFLEKKWQNLKITKVHVYYLVMLFFFLLAFIYYPFDSTEYFRKLIENRYPLLGIGIIGFFGVNKKYKLNYFLNTIIVSSVLVILYLIFFKIGIVNFLTDPEREDLFTHSRIEFVNQHMMFNFYLNLALIAIWYIITNSWRQTKRLNRYLYIAAMTLIFFVLYLSEGRSGFLAGILLMLSFIFVEIWKRKRVLGLMIGFMIPFLFVFMASSHERISKESILHESRFFLWEAAIEVIEDSPFWGNGISRAQEKYDQVRTLCETEEYYDFWHRTKKVKLLDSHSQYLQSTMEFGVFGILLVLFLYIYPFFIVEKKRRLFSFFILWLCMYQSVFDMFITGQFGLLFGLLTLLILWVDDNIGVNPKKEELDC